MSEQFYMADEGLSGVAYERASDLVHITPQNIDFYFPEGGLSGLDDAGGLGIDAWGVPQNVPPTLPPSGHSTRDAVIQLVNRGLEIFASTRTGNVYTKDQQQAGLLLDENGNLKLSPLVMLLGVLGVYLLFKQPPTGRRG